MLPSVSVTPEDQKHIEAVEEQRRRREAALLALLLLFIGGSALIDGTLRRNQRSALHAAMQAVSLGIDPVEAMKRVIQGDPKLHLPGIGPSLEAAARETFAAGEDFAASEVGAPKPPPSAPPSSQTPPTGKDDAEYRRRRDAALAALLLLGGVAVSGLVDNLTRVIRKTQDDAKATGLTTPQTAALIRDNFIRYGFTRHPPSKVNPDSKGSPGFALAGMAEDTILKAWGDGHWIGGQAFVVATLIWGYRHISVIDNATTDICLDRGLPEPVQYRKENGYWRGASKPPLHPRCRSMLRTLSTASPHEESERYPTVPPKPGWGRGPLPGP